MNDHKEYKFVTLLYSADSDVVYAQSDGHVSLYDEASGSYPAALDYLHQLGSDGWEVVPSSYTDGKANTRIVILVRAL